MSGAEQQADAAAAEEDSAEAVVGITEYANDAAGFVAVLKQRFSDFIVNEIALDGTVAHLVFPPPPPPPPQPPPPPAAEPAAAAAASVEQAPPDAGEPVPDTEAALDAFAVVAGAEDAARLRDWLAAAPANGKRREPLPLTPTADKNRRTQVHQCIARVLRDSHGLDTDTVDADAPAGAKCVRVLDAGGRRRQGGGGGRGGGGRKRKRDGAEEGGGSAAGRYLRFVLCKENRDTHDALGIIGRMLRLQSGALGFAGTKDKRGVTCQFITLDGGSAQRVAALNARLHGIRVGGFERCEEPLVLGQLRGNEFTITLRYVRCAAGGGDVEAVVAAAVAALRRSGFVNYFGLQRFGAFAGSSTHAVGAALLRGQWQAAVDLLLSAKPGERADTAAARAHWLERGDAAAAAAAFPPYCVPERALLDVLSRQRNNVQGALMAVPKTMRMMYLHAYQSFLWNHAASERMRLGGGGATAIEGDLVYEAEEGWGGEGAPPVSKDAGGGGGELPAVREVTAAEAAAGAVPLARVVLPLAAPGIRYPRNASGDVYARLAARDGVDLAAPQHAVRAFSMASLHGGYRRLVLRPERLEWALLRHRDPREDVTQSDWSRFLAAEGGAGAAAAGAGAGGEGDLLALRLTFPLPSSAYATMLLRELFKSSTSKPFQSALGTAGIEAAGDGAAAAAGEVDGEAPGVEGDEAGAGAAADAE